MGLSWPGPLPHAAPRRGTARPDEIILVGAHYDSVQGCPGADDNASGVAALLEIGRGLRDRATGRTVRLVAFVNEEPPFFWWGQMGSMVYARAARRRGDDIRLMISLEMLGCYSQRRGSQRYPPLFRFFYPDRGNFIAMVSNLRSRGSQGSANGFPTAFRDHGQGFTHVGHQDLPDKLQGLGNGRQPGIPPLFRRPLLQRQPPRTRSRSHQSSVISNL